MEVQGREITAQRDMLIQQRQSIDDSILYASYIQKALLPSEDILKENFTDSFILYKPRNIIGGDFYFYKKIDDSIIIAAADCTGHGVPGALLSMLGIASLSEIVYRLGITNTSVILTEMCREMRSIIKRNNKYDAKDGIDIALCKINLNTKELQFSGAYNPVYIIRNKELIQLKADRIPVGTSIFEREPKFTNQDIKLQKGDSIYLFSDGFADQLSPTERKKYLARNFQNLLVNESGKNMDKQKEILEHEFEKWRNGGDQTDDLMVLGIKI
jgi:serine phosphatase RsbU (regulator of sigma subunit)